MQCTASCGGGERSRVRECALDTAETRASGDTRCGPGADAETEVGRMVGMMMMMVMMMMARCVTTPRARTGLPGPPGPSAL